MVNITWAAIGKTIRGATHQKNGTPCQDALSVTHDEKGAYCVVCLADGHGSVHCPFSDEGAQAAVDIARDIFVSILTENAPGEAFAVFDAHKEIWLPKQIETQWKKQVRALHQAKERPAADPFPYALYGATLLALVATPHFVFALQLGDGDIVSIDDGVNAAWVFPPEGIRTPETDSLCLSQCWQYVKTRIMPLSETSNPVLPFFLLSTDGYADSFSEPKGFIKAGLDIYHLWRDNGPDYIDEHLPDWLLHSSAGGSGDDITAALVFTG